MERPTAPVTLVDGHVHLYPRFPLVPFLEGAHRNLRRAVGCLPGEWLGVLCLSQSPGEGAFERLERHGRTGEAPGPWSVSTTAEDTSLEILSDDGARLIVIAGRQIRTRERLEVLAIGTRTRFAEDEPLEHVLRAVAEEGAIPIVPWGFGKWVGARKRLVERLIRDPDLPRFFLGDNGNRPGLLGRPGLFALAESHGVLDLPGSDPLPLRGEHHTVGRTGFVLDVALDRSAPARELKGLLDDRRTPLPGFGRPETTLRFLRNQVALRFRDVSSARPASTGLPPSREGEHR